MPRGYQRWVFVLWLAGLGGCMDSCDCGAEQGAEHAPKGGAPVVVAPSAGASGGGAPSDSDAGVPPVYTMRGYVPLEDGELKTRVEALKKRVAWEKRLGKPIAQAALLKVLADRVGDYRAAEPAVLDTREVGDVHVMTATRQYKSAQGSLYLKVSDTAAAVPLRTGFRDMLLVVADEAGGNQRPELFDDSLGLVAYHAHERVSRAMMLLRERFLIELIARDTDDPDAAKKALKALPLTSLR